MLGGGGEEIEWTSDIDFGGDDYYDRAARGRLSIDGPRGPITVIKQFRATAGDGNGVINSGVIRQTTSYYYGTTSEMICQTSHSWNVSEDLVSDRQAFLKQCRSALEAIPEIEYQIGITGKEIKQSSEGTS